MNLFLKTIPKNSSGITTKHRRVSTLVMVGLLMILQHGTAAKSGQEEVKVGDTMQLLDGFQQKKQ